MRERDRQTDSWTDRDRETEKKEKQKDGQNVHRDITTDTGEGWDLYLIWRLW